MALSIGGSSSSATNRPTGPDLSTPGRFNAAARRPPTGEGDMGVPPPAYRGPGDRLLTRRRVPVGRRRRALRPAGRGEAAVTGGGVPRAEARAGGGPAVDPGPEAACRPEGHRIGSPGRRGGENREGGAIVSHPVEVGNRAMTPACAAFWN